jgi:hypothetical protein
VETKCGEFVVPESHLKPCKTCDTEGRRCRESESIRTSRGVENADFVLYVSAVATPQCQETIGKNIIRSINHCLAASTECSAGSNDHFVVGGAVPSLVQFDGRPLGGANFQQ